MASLRQDSRSVGDNIFDLVVAKLVFLRNV